MKSSPALWSARAAVVLSLLAACQDDEIPLSVDVPGSLVEGSAPPLAPGEVETVLELTPRIDRLEGIAIDRRGHLFFGNTRLDGDVRVSEILQISPEGVTSVFATLDPTTDLINGGVAGLAVSPQGDLYAALPTLNPATHGVWRIERGGAAERLPGSEAMEFPNALAFDARGNLYVTDTPQGTVWRFGRNLSGEVWIRHELLSPGDFGIGANGIAFSPPRDLFVANTDRALVARIPIRTEFDAFDFPTSLAFGAGRRDRKSVYVVNSGIFPEDPARMPRPGVVRIAVGVPGAPTH